MPENFGNDSDQIGHLSSKDCFDMLEHAPIGVFTSTPEGRFFSVNPALVRMYGYATREELINSINDITSQLYADPADRDAFRRLLEEQGELINYEYRLLRKDGSIFWVSTTVRSVLDDQGNIIYYQGFTTEITDRKQSEAAAEKNRTRRKQAEDELRHKHAFLQGIIESSPTPFFSVDREYRYTSFNLAHARRMKELYGVVDIELGHSLYEYQTVPEDSQKFRINIDRALRGEQFIEEACPGRQDLSRQYIKVTHNPIRDKHGQVIGVSVFIDDITERKKAEEKLLESEEKYRCLVEQSADMMYLHDLEGHFLDVNQAAVSNTGYSREELLGMSVFDIHLDRSSHDELPKVWGKWRTKQSEIIETMHLRKDGSTFVAEVKVGKVHFGGEDYILALVRDITERKRAEKARQESEEKFRIVFEQSAIGMGRVNFTDAHWIDVNETFCNMLGYTPEEMRATPWPDITHPDDVDLDLIPFRRMAAGNLENYTVEKRFIHKQGHHVWARLTLSLVRDLHGQPDYQIAIIENIAQRKMAEEALRALTDTLEHQVAERTALAESRARQLQALAVELIEAEERERQRIAELLHDDLQQMLASARFQLQATGISLQNDQIFASVNEILEESIAISRRLSHELSPPVLYHGSLYSALEWLRRQMNEQFGLTIELKDEESPNLENTPLKVFLFRAVRELLFNIVKHADVKSARVTLMGSTDTIAVFVADQGKGFNKDIIDSSPERPGFGLISIRERADRIGGHLKIESGPGQGSSFLLVLPVQTAPAKVPVETGELTDAAVPQSISVVKRLRVLFADDHKVMRQGLITLISGQTDIEVAGEAANGREAVELARQLRPDVIVMDISMPVMDGIEATRLIKSQFPEVRIVGLSMFEDKQSIKNIIHAGADAFVPKTASPEAFLNAIYGN